jgi:CBS domain-containing protein
MKLLKIAHVPPTIVGMGATVMEAVEVMARDRVGAVAIIDVPGSGALKGIFSERDLMLRVVRRGRDPGATQVRDVMTLEVKTATEDTLPAEAMSLMLSLHLRHLPIIGTDRQVLGILSIRDLLENKVDDLSRSLDSMEQYITNDSMGG